MNPRAALKLVIALVASGAVSLASAKLPAPPSVDPVKAEEAKQKAAEAAKQEADALARAQDRAANHYKKQKAGSAVTVKATPAAAPPKK